MDKREQVLKTITGELTGYVPSCFSLHFPPEEATGEKGIESHIRFHKATDMDILKIMNENVSWNYYAMAGDHLAMFSQGNWFTRLLNSQADYPRDWKYGIARTPAPEGYDNNIVSAAYNSINVNAEHPEEALEYVIWLSENQWKFEGGIPAYAEMTEEDREIAFGSIAEASDGQITVDDLYNCLVNNGMGAVQSDIIGVAADEYNRIANEELQAYFLDLQDLDTAMANITRRVNEAIESYM